MVQARDLGRHLQCTVGSRRGPGQAVDRLQQATIEKDGKAVTVRTPTAGMVGSVFQATGVAIPANIREQAA